MKTFSEKIITLKLNYVSQNLEAVAERVLQKRKTGKHLCQSLFFNKVALLKKTLAQVFSCEFCEIFTNTFLRRALQVAASDNSNGLLGSFPMIQLARSFELEKLYTHELRNLL